jgi:hypothetical protein
MSEFACLGEGKRGEERGAGLVSTDEDVDEEGPGVVRCDQRFACM